MRRLLAVSAILGIILMAAAGPAAAKEPPQDTQIGISGGDLDRELRTPAGFDVIRGRAPNGAPRATPYRLTLYGRFPGEPAVRSLVSYDLYLDSAGRPTVLRQLEPVDWLTLSDTGAKSVEAMLLGAGIRLTPPKTVSAPKPAGSSYFPAVLAVAVAALIALAAAVRIRSGRAPAREARA